MSLAIPAPATTPQMLLSAKLLLPGPTGGLALVDVPSAAGTTERFVAVGSLIETVDGVVLTIDEIDPASYVVTAVRDVVPAAA